MKKQFFTKVLALSLVFSSALTLTNAQNSCIKNQRTLGGSGDDTPTSTIAVPGGYVISGYTNSDDGNFNVPANHDVDGFIVKYNNFGQIVWKRTYGGTGYDDLFNIKATSDGGYIATGTTSSNDGDVSGNHGGDEDIWVVKFNSHGLIQWQHCYGGTSDDYTNSITVVPNGYVIAGASNSNDGDVSGNHGDYDAWILKISNNGSIINSHSFGGSGFDRAISYMKNANGTFTFSGGTNSNDGDVSGNHGGDEDTWVVNANANNTINWQKCLGGSGTEFSHGFVRTTDGKIVLHCPTTSDDGDVDGNPGHVVAWYAKLNPLTGNIIWNKTYKKVNAEVASLGAFATSDGGLLSMGGIGDAGNFVTDDAIIRKLDSNGNSQWEKIIGGSNQDDVGFLMSGIQRGNDYLVCIPTASTDGDVKNSHGGVDGWLVTLGNCCNHHRDGIEVENNFSMDVFPNPVSTSTTISFSLTESQNVSLQVFDVNGKLVSTISEKVFDAGENQIEFNAEKLNAGIYILKMQVGDVLKTKKLVVTK